MSGSFPVEQPEYKGPIDLLLQLVQRREVAIDAIRLGEIIDAYLAHVDVLEHLDVDDAARFLQVASILLEWKSRLLLEPEPIMISSPADVGLSPDLIRNLLAYRLLRDQTGILDELQMQGALRFGRGPTSSEGFQQHFEDLSAWDLCEAYNRLQRALGGGAPRLVDADQTPIEAHIQDLQKRLESGVRLALEDLFAEEGEKVDRGLWIGRFLAILEMARCQLVSIHQPESFGKIEVERC